MSNRSIVGLVLFSVGFVGPSGCKPAQPAPAQPAQPVQPALPCPEGLQRFRDGCLTQANVAFQTCVEGLAIDKKFKEKTFTQLKGDPTVNVRGVNIDVAVSYLKSSLREATETANSNASKLIDVCSLNASVPPPAVSMGSPVTEYGNKNPALPEHIPDGWVNFLFQSQDGDGKDCPPSSSEPDTKNILADIHPTLYGDESKGSLFTEAKPGFYQVQTADSCLPGGNHGGFKYEFTNPIAQTPLGRKYTLSFCAQSINADRLVLAVQHENGQGQVTCLSRSALITTKRQRFSWVCSLDGYQYSPGVINSPQRYLFFYLADLTNQRGCIKDNSEADKMFGARKFEISDLRLEMSPNPTGSGPQGQVGR